MKRYFVTGMMLMLLMVASNALAGPQVFEKELCGDLNVKTTVSSFGGNQVAVVEILERQTVRARAALTASYRLANVEYYFQNKHYTADLTFSPAAMFSEGQVILKTKTQCFGQTRTWTMSIASWTGM